MMKQEKCTTGGTVCNGVGHSAAQGLDGQQEKNMRGRQQKKT
jgi:hypothetical protein